MVFFSPVGVVCVKPWQVNVRLFEFSEKALACIYGLVDSLMGLDLVRRTESHTEVQLIACRKHGT